jgi:hypothetical protein
MACDLCTFNLMRRLSPGFVNWNCISKVSHPCYESQQSDQEDSPSTNPLILTSQKTGLSTELNNPGRPIKRPWICQTLTRSGSVRVLYLLIHCAETRHTIIQPWQES